VGLCFVIGVTIRCLFIITEPNRITLSVVSGLA
jgi:hypothetical protein